MLLEYAQGHAGLCAMLLILLPFAHEDVAIAMGALMIQVNAASLILVVGALMIGLVGSDVAIYAIGFLARRFITIQEFLDRPRIAAVTSVLQQHIFACMVLARLVPGLTFPVYVALGARGADLVKFIVCSIIFSVIYLGAILSLIDVVQPLVPGSPELATFGAVAAVMVVLFGARQVSAFVHTHAGGRGTPATVRAWFPNSAVAPAHPRPVAAAERIPPMLFYAPLALNWLRLSVRYRSLSVPTAANPDITLGGLWGEAKSEYFASAGPRAQRYMLPWVKLELEAAQSREARLSCCRQAIAAAGLDLPVVVKPDIGWQGFGVRPVASEAELGDYLDVFPGGTPLLLQQLSRYSGEAGILVARHPVDGRPRIVSLAIRHHPMVVGDGRSTVAALMATEPRLQWKKHLYDGGGSHAALPEDLLESIPAPGECVQVAFIGSQRVGGFYEDGRRLITPALERRFAEIVDDLGEFHYGRFDVRFDDAADLAGGEGFEIVEINGIGSEAIHVWDPRYSVREVYGALFDQQRLLFEIGAANRARGIPPAGARAIFSAAAAQRRLTSSYPPSV